VRDLVVMGCTWGTMGSGEEFNGGAGGTILKAVGMMRWG
jgi:hypothetical protein